MYKKSIFSIGLMSNFNSGKTNQKPKGWDDEIYLLTSPPDHPDFTLLISYLLVSLSFLAHFHFLRSSVTKCLQSYRFCQLTKPHIFSMGFKSALRAGHKIDPVLAFTALVENSQHIARMYSYSFPSKVNWDSPLNKRIMSM